MYWLLVVYGLFALQQSCILCVKYRFFFLFEDIAKKLTSIF